MDLFPLSTKTMFGQLSESDKFICVTNFNYLLKEQFINQISKNRNVLVTYPSFTNQDNIFMPTGVSIIANQQNQVKINVAYKKITFNESLSFPYSIPEGYSQIKID